MNIYESMERYMRSLDKQQSHLSYQLRGVVEVINGAWAEIPEQYRGALHDAAFAAAKHFGLATKPDSSPPPWLMELERLQKGVAA